MCRGWLGVYLRRKTICSLSLLVLFNSCAARRGSAVDLAAILRNSDFIASIPRANTNSTMLDNFEILTTSGVVLWSKSYASVSPSIINSLIKDVFIEEKVPSGSGNNLEEGPTIRNPTYKKEKYTLKWSSVKELGLIFVVILLFEYSQSKY